MLGLVESLPALIIASALTGFAGALSNPAAFNPAARAYLAQEAGDRKKGYRAEKNDHDQGRHRLSWGDGSPEAEGSRTDEEKRDGCVPWDSAS
ncbi:hypothetical protein OG884_16510 [Streptosporangium sp. NBC_01755]|uniref:hypothetical protein n=1 Tax=unclassified Streptosporangium TaxID=2632669 RepID=UPI002DDA1754|nr:MULTISPECIES: hypothetical protein [unclassified Streptosporangium]WSA25256.1 hypothetical protein OIE13_30720 [Streptosporangium sp. NBC_01810]WSD03427.1 hypothetical protein OG884_16510 [Streptosporangium sp. NBC_01755]